MLLGCKVQSSGGLALFTEQATEDEAIDSVDTSDSAQQDGEKQPLPLLDKRPLQPVIDTRHERHVDASDEGADEHETARDEVIEETNDHDDREVAQEESPDHYGDAPPNNEAVADTLVQRTQPAIKEQLEEKQSPPPSDDEMGELMRMVIRMNNRIASLEEELATAELKAKTTTQVTEVRSQAATQPAASQTPREPKATSGIERTEYDDLALRMRTLELLLLTSAVRSNEDRVVVVAPESQPKLPQRTAASDDSQRALLEDSIAKLNQQLRHYQTLSTYRIDSARFGITAPAATSTYLSDMRRAQDSLAILIDQMREARMERPDTVYIASKREPLPAPPSQPDTLFFVARYGMGALLPENLDNVTARVKKATDGYDSYTVKIASHTDRSGSAAANLSISKRRAEALSSELVKRGLNASNIYVQWFGSEFASKTSIEFERRAEISVILAH